MGGGDTGGGIDRSGLSTGRLRLALVLTWVLGVLLAAAAFMLVRDLEQARARVAFVDAAGPEARFVRGRILQKLEAVYAVRGLFDASVAVERDEFITFTQNVVQRHGGVGFFAWVPAVSGEAEPGWQAEMGRQGFGHLRIGGVGGTAPGDLRLPLTFIAPANRFDALLGLDLGSEPSCREAMQRSLESGEAAATPRLDIVHNGVRVDGPLVFLAVYRGGVSGEAAERRNALLGFVVAALEVGAVLEAAVADGASPDYELAVFDDDAPPDRQVLAHGPGRHAGRADVAADRAAARDAGLELSAAVAVGGRRWTIACFADPHLTGVGRSWWPWGALAVGLLFTAALAGYVSSAGRARAAATLVANRNDELERLNRTLIEDVDRRRILEAELRESEARYRRIVETAQEGIWALDENAITTFVNERMAEMLGYTVPEMLGRSLFDFMDEAGKAVALEKLEGRRQGVREEHDFRFRRADGRDVWALVSTNPLIDADGTYRGALGMLTDITDRKRRENELFASRQMLRLVLDNIPQRVFWKDRQMLYLGCNRVFAADTGLVDPEAIVGKSDFELSWREFAPLYRADDAQVMETDAAKVNFEEPLVVHGGGRRWLRTSKVPLHGVDGSVIGMLGMYEDITEHKEAEEALRAAHAALDAKAEELARSNRDLEQFAYIASHDLQEPLRTVKAYLELIAERYGDRLDQDGKEFLGYAVDGAQRMRGMIQALLAYSRVGSRGGAAEPVAADAALDAALAALALAIEDSGAEIVREPLPTVLADAGQLTALFQNLLANGMKFGRPGVVPRVRVRAVATDGAWQFAVTDNGIGIPAESRDRLFGLFQRVNPAAAHPGSGIGLAICKRIVERHGGRIWVESTPGEGSTFYFTLPRAAA